MLPAVSKWCTLFQSEWIWSVLVYDGQKKKRNLVPLFPTSHFLKAAVHKSSCLHLLVGKGAPRLLISNLKNCPCAASVSPCLVSSNCWECSGVTSPGIPQEGPWLSQAKPLWGMRGRLSCQLVFTDSHEHNSTKHIECGQVFICSWSP